MTQPISGGAPSPAASDRMTAAKVPQKVMDLEALLKMAPTIRENILKGLFRKRNKRF